MTNEELFQKVGSNIVRLRESKGLRQIDLAIKIDMEASSLRRIEKGRTNQTLGMLLKIANALEVSINSLIS